MPHTLATLLAYWYRRKASVRIGMHPTCLEDPVESQILVAAFEMEPLPSASPLG